MKNRTETFDQYDRTQRQRLADIAAQAFAAAETCKPAGLILYSGLPGTGMVTRANQVGGDIGVLTIEYDQHQNMVAGDKRGQPVQDPVDVMKKNEGQRRIILIPDAEGLKQLAALRLEFLMQGSLKANAPADPENVLIVLATHARDQINPGLAAHVTADVKVPAPRA